MKIEQEIKNYKSKVQKALKANKDMNESGVRILINDFLEKVLGYTSFEDIKTEYVNKLGFADYVLQTSTKNTSTRIIVEVKAVNISLKEKVLLQGKGYAIETGIYYILLSNGVQFELHRLEIKEKVPTTCMFSFDILQDNIKNIIPHVELITKKSVSKGLLNNKWQQLNSTAPEKLAEYLMKDKVVKVVKKLIDTDTKIKFKEDDILDSIYKVITTQIDIKKPMVKKSLENKKDKKIDDTLNINTLQ